MITTVQNWKRKQNSPWIPEAQQVKHFPEADGWMWNYCEFLGSYTAPSGLKYDLGLWLGGTSRCDSNGGVNPSYAIVYSNVPGSYISGPVSYRDTDPQQLETIRRGLELGFIKTF